jgi:predicted aconitase
VHLTDEEQQILDGALGEPQRIALGVLVKLGEAYGADRLVEIASAHLVASSYQIAGEAGIEIYTQLVEQEARVKVAPPLTPAPSISPAGGSSRPRKSMPEGRSGSRSCWTGWA